MRSKIAFWSMASLVVVLSGPAYVPGAPDDGIERGLLGYIINAGIENQFEFVMGGWLNGYEFVGASRLIPRSKDLIVGRDSDPAKSVFEIPQPEGAPPLTITGSAAGPGATAASVGSDVLTYGRSKGLFAWPVTGRCDI